MIASSCARQRSMRSNLPVRRRRPLVGARAPVRVREQIVHATPISRARSAPYDREPMTGAEHLRKERDDVDVQHGAMSFFRALFRIAPVVPAGPLERGSQALRAGDLVEASAPSPKRWRRRIPSASGPWRTTNGPGGAGRGDRPAAEAALDEALRTYAACVPAMVKRGNLLLEDGDVDGAIARFEAAILLDPDIPRPTTTSAWRFGGRPPK